MRITKRQLKEMVEKEIESLGSPTDRYQLYQDLDGCLCDFDKDVHKLLNEKFKIAAENKEEWSKIKPDKKNKKYMMYKLCNKVADQIGGWDKEIQIEDFRNKGAARNFSFAMIKNKKWLWENFDWTAGGKTLWNFIAPYKPMILTSPVDEASIQGKYVWCKKNLGLGPDRIIIAVNKNIDTGDKTGILIDDTPKKIAQFPDIGILYKTGNPGPAIEKLKKYGFE